VQKNRNTVQSGGSRCEFACGIRFWSAEIHPKLKLFSQTNRRAIYKMRDEMRRRDLARKARRGRGEKSARDRLTENRFSSKILLVHTCAPGPSLHPFPERFRPEYFLASFSIAVSSPDRRRDPALRWFSGIGKTAPRIGASVELNLAPNFYAPQENAVNEAVVVPFRIFHGPSGRLRV
jgi:hypothetical protein